MPFRGNKTERINKGLTNDSVIPSKNVDPGLCHVPLVIQSESHLREFLTFKTFVGAVPRMGWDKSKSVDVQFPAIFEFDEMSKRWHAQVIPGA